MSFATWDSHLHSLSKEYGVYDSFNFEYTETIKSSILRSSLFKSFVIKIGEIDLGFMNTAKDE